MHQQKISSIHPFILAIQQILESRLKKGHTHPEFVSPFKKSVYSIDSIMRYSQFKSPVTRVAAPIFEHIFPWPSQYIVLSRPWPTPIFIYYMFLFFLSNQNFKNRLGHTYGKSLFRLKVCLHYAYSLNFC